MKPTATADAPGRPALTAKQAGVLRYVVQFWGAHAYPPTIRDVMIAFRFASPNAVVGHLRLLAKKGYLTPVSDVSRGLVIPELVVAARKAADEYLGGLPPVE